MLGTTTHESPSGRVPRRRAMTLVEMVIAVLLIGAVLFLLVGWMDTIRTESRLELARRMLVELDRALARYYRANEMFPPTVTPDSAVDVTVQLLNHDRTRPLLLALPDSVWRGEGRPVFVSAGPDRDFGDDDRTCVGDNLRSDDPGRDGFRPQLSSREPGAEVEK